MASRYPRRAPKRPSTHSGAILREDVIPALGKSKAEIARRLGVSRQALYNVLSEKAPITPEMVPLPRAPAVFGLSRSGLYRLAAEGRVRMVKMGARTLVDAASVRTFLAGLPAVRIGGPKPPGAMRAGDHAGR